MTGHSGEPMSRWNDSGLLEPTEKAVAEYQRQQQGPTVALDDALDDVCWQCGTPYSGPDDGCDACDA